MVVSKEACLAELDEAVTVATLAFSAVRFHALRKEMHCPSEAVADEAVSPIEGQVWKRHDAESHLGATLSYADMDAYSEHLASTLMGRVDGDLIPAAARQVHCQHLG